MKTILIAATLLIPVLSLAQSKSAELTCRAQSKEIAMETYSNCMTTARNQQVEDIRKNYKKELQAVKSKYEGELKKLSSASAKNSKANLKAAPIPTAAAAAPTPTPEVKPETPVDSSVESAQNLSETEIIEMPSQE